MFKRNRYYKDVVGKRQMYRRIAQEVKQTVELLELQTTNIPTNSEDTLKNSDSNNQHINLESHEVHDSFLNADVSEELVNSEIVLTSTSVDTHLGYNSEGQKMLNGEDLVNNLQQWALSNQVSHKAVSELLHVLNSFHPSLPLDARTLLKTPLTRPNYKNLETGEYVHLGLTNNIKIFLKNNPKYTSQIVKISFNIDGIPVFTNSLIQFWPILGIIKSPELAEEKCFAIEIFCGKSKPAPLTLFLGDFVSELKHLMNEGLNYKCKVYRIEVHSFICDAPAKAFIKCIKSHSGYSSCDKCTVAGDYVNGRVIFNSLSSQKRTNQSFLQQIDEDHHTGLTPLTELNVDIVNDFPIDYMHCVCLGVTKKLLTCWISGSIYEVRLGRRSVTSISDYLNKLSSSLPSDFNRRPEKLSDIAHWKATQFRTFLLYMGPIVLKGKVNIAQFY